MSDINIQITGGTDATNTDIIKWLQDNGTLTLTPLDTTMWQLNAVLDLSKDLDVSIDNDDVSWNTCEYYDNGDVKIAAWSFDGLQVSTNGYVLWTYGVPNFGYFYNEQVFDAVVAQFEAQGFTIDQSDITSKSGYFYVEQVDDTTGKFHNVRRDVVRFNSDDWDGNAGFINWLTNSAEQLDEYVIPNDVVEIGLNSFWNCNSFETITIPDSVTSIGEYAFRGCDILTSINIPDSVTEIGKGAFSYCTELTGIMTLDNVTSIGVDAFYDCNSITSVIIGNSVTEIGETAFLACDSLTGITIKATIPPSKGVSVFDSTNDCPIYVPAQSANAYKTAWSEYEDRIQAIPVTGYSITYHENGGTPKPDDLTNQTNLPSPLPTVSKADFSFGGWYYDDEFQNEAYAGDTLVANVDLYAKFTRTHITLDLSTIGLSAGTHSIRMKLSDDEVTKADSEFSNTVTYVQYRQLAAPVISLSGSILTWQPVEHAVAYGLFADSTSEGIGVNPGVDLSTLQLDVGSHSIYVIARGSGYYTDSVASNTVTYVVVPTYSITGTATNATINGQASYSGTIAEGGSVTLTLGADGTNYKLPTLIEVTGATGDYTRTSDMAGTLTISSPIDSVSFSVVGELIQTQLDAPTDLTADGTTISFNEVGNAEEYEVFANGVSIGEYTQPTTETWVINERPSISNFIVDINFTSNNVQYNKIQGATINGLFYMGTLAYDKEELAWTNQAYRTVTFETAPTDELLTWLQANAVKQ